MLSWAQGILGLQHLDFPQSFSILFQLFGFSISFQLNFPLHYLFWSPYQLISLSQTSLLFANLLPSVDSGICLNCWSLNPAVLLLSYKNWNIVTTEILDAGFFFGLDYTIGNSFASLPKACVRQCGWWHLNFWYLSFLLNRKATYVCDPCLMPLTFDLWQHAFRNAKILFFSHQLFASNNFSPQKVCTLGSWWTNKYINIP